MASSQVMQKNNNLDLEPHERPSYRRLGTLNGLLIGLALALGAWVSEALSLAQLPIRLQHPSLVLGSLILILVASVRELVGSGSLLDHQILPLVRDGGWYEPNGLLLLAPGAFFLIGLIIWVVRTWKPAQAEKPEYQIQVVHRTEAL